MAFFLKLNTTIMPQKTLTQENTDTILVKNENVYKARMHPICVY